LKISSDVCDAAYKLEQARADSNMISYNKEATANAKLVKSNEALTEKVNRKNKTITYLIIAVVAIPPLLYYIDKANGD
jgi:glycosylphosphatidylinositol transamidase (GPIT) subunit GPI8